MHPRSTIDRYVADGLLDEGAERELRAHLKGCAACRGYYDEQRSALRAVSGDVNEPTADEKRLHSRLALDTVFPAATAASSRRFSPRELFERLFWSPARTWGLGATALAAVILVVVLMPKGGSGELPLAATVARADGATRKGESLEVGGELRALDVVDVPRGALLEVELVRGGLVRVFPETRFALGPRGESVTLDKGKVWCLPEEGRGGFEVTTPSATVRVLGTSFVVDADDEKTDVRVVTGSVEVTDLDERGRVRLQTEESTRVVRGERPSAPRRANASADTLQWQRVVDQLVRDIQKGFKSLGRQLQQGRR